MYNNKVPNNLREFQIKGPYNETAFVALPVGLDDVDVGGHDVAGLAFRAQESARVGPHLCRVLAADAVALERKGQAFDLSAKTMTAYRGAWWLQNCNIQSHYQLKYSNSNAI